MNGLLVGTGTALALEIEKTLLASGHHLTVAGLAESGCAGCSLSTFFFMDVTKQEAIEACFTHLQNPVEFIVYAAGCGSSTPLTEHNRDTWENVFAVNVFGARDVMRFAAQLAVKQNAPVVFILISSINSDVVVPQYSAYCASRAAAEMLAKVAAVELAPHLRIFVLAIGPLADTASTLLNIDAFRTKLAKRHVIAHRLTHPADVANWVSLLIEPRAGWVTGQTIAIDGGVRLNFGQLP